MRTLSKVPTITVQPIPLPSENKVEIGPCILHLGDCLDRMSSYTDDIFPLCITDVPYSVINRSSGGLRILDKGAADDSTFEIIPFIKSLSRIVSGSCYVFCSTEQVSQIRETFVAEGLTTRLCVWEKTNPSPMNGQHLWLSSVECFVFARKSKATFNEHCQSPVFRFPVPRRTGHPTPKSIPLCKRLILASSNENDTVFDPCFGGGNIGVAAVEAGRRFEGIEINPGYFEIGVQRIEHAAKQFAGLRHGDLGTVNQSGLSPLCNHLTGTEQKPSIV